MKQPEFRSWMWINLKIGALSFGSASRILLYEDEVVRKYEWLSNEDFQEALTLAQVLPGPNLVNLAACLGYKFFSIPAAILALLGLILPGAILVVLTALWVPLDRPWIAELFQGFAIGAFLLMGRFLFNLFKGMSAGNTGLAPTKKVMGRYLLSVAFSIAALEGAPLLPLIFGGVAIGLIWEFLC